MTDDVEYRLEKESAETLLDILAPYKEIHTLTGHSHRQMLTRMPEKNIVDHNITSASGSTWWTSAMGCKSIGTDGIPGGYEVFTIDGNDSASNSVKHMKDRTPSHVRNLSVFDEKSATIVKPLHL